MSNDKVKGIARLIVRGVQSRIDAINYNGSYTQSDSQYFAKMERRMMFLVKASGQEDFELYTQLLGTGWMIRNATVFTQWKKNPEDIISLLMWVRSEL